MARKRFNAEEKAIIADSLPIEWQNVTQWHPGSLIGNINVDNGWQYVEVMTMENAGILRKGETVRVSPGHIRRPAVHTETRRVAPSESEWYAHAVIGSEDETSEVDDYFAGSKPTRSAFLPLPDGWKIIEFSVKSTVK